MVSFPSSTLVCFFAVFVSIATSLCFLPRSSEPFRHGLLFLFFFIYPSQYFPSIFIHLSPSTPATSRLLFLIDFYFMRCESPRYFRRSLFFYIYFASISLSFHVEFLFSYFVLSLRISPFDSYFPASSLSAITSNESQHGFKTSYLLSRIFSYYRPYSCTFTLLIPSHTLRV